MILGCIKRKSSFSVPFLFHRKSIQVSKMHLYFVKSPIICWLRDSCLWLKLSCHFYQRIGPVREFIRIVCFVRERLETWS